MSKQPPLEIRIDLRAVTGQFDLSYTLERIKQVVPEKAVITFIEGQREDNAS